MKNINFFILIYIFVAPGISSCEKASGPRKYEEIVIEPLSASMQLPPGHPPIDNPSTPNTSIRADSAIASELKWTPPQGWQSFSADGMRLATFKTQDENPIECSIVSLGGLAGGLEANITRWMRQINLTEIPENELQEFLKKQKIFSSQGGFSIQMLDFTSLQQNLEDSVPSMIAAIVTLPEKTVFVKMTGTKEAVLKNKNKFEKLCQSLRGTK